MTIQTLDLGECPSNVTDENTHINPVSKDIETYSVIFFR